MDLKLFEQEIRKTGFVLENRIAQELKSAGWTVISNKYYVDDTEESVREIDLVAYRISKVQHFNVCTALIISCKKSDSNAWALLARDANLKDPNADWWPLHAWTNDKALNFQLAEVGKARRYHEQLTALGVCEALRVPDVEVFAFQEMDKTSGKPQNDKPIFTALTSLMKAQAYELSALPDRKKAPCIYQFNLLSVVDTDLIRLKFDGAEIHGSQLETEHYLARYIVRKHETFSRIRFVTAKAFGATLQDYGRLHVANCTWFGKECDSFYSGLLDDPKRIAVLDEAFKKAVNWSVSWRLEHRFGQSFDIGVPSLELRKLTNDLGIGYLVPPDVLAHMNEDKQIRSVFAKALHDIYRYDGNFCFVDDIIPF